MSGKRWHVPSASATPWDGIGDEDLTPSQIAVRDSHRSVYEFRHRALSEAGDAGFLNGYARDRCPRYGCDRSLVSPCGLLTFLASPTGGKEMLVDNRNYTSDLQQQL